MWRRLDGQIAVEEAQLVQLSELNQPLLSECRAHEPTLIELQAAAAFLHSFYSGIENIFRRVAVELDGGSPAGGAWHKRLLRQMAAPAEQRPRVISEELHLRLLEYLNFRHVFRGAYLFQLDWERMAPLVLEVEQVLTDFRTELATFRSVMEESARGRSPQSE